MASLAMTATAAAAQPRRLTGLRVPRSSRKSVAASAAAKAQRCDVECHLHRVLPAQDGEGDDRCAHGGEDQDVGGEKRQPEEQWHLVEDDGVRGATEGQFDRHAVGDHVQHTDHGEHGALGNDETYGPQAVERADQAEPGGEQCEESRVGVDGDDEARA